MLLLIRWILSKGIGIRCIVLLVNRKVRIVLFFVILIRRSVGSLMWRIRIGLVRIYLRIWLKEWRDHSWKVYFWLFFRSMGYTFVWEKIGVVDSCWGYCWCIAIPIEKIKRPCINPTRLKTLRRLSTLTWSTDAVDQRPSTPRKSKTDKYLVSSVAKKTEKRFHKYC